MPRRILGCLFCQEVQLMLSIMLNGFIRSQLRYGKLYNAQMARESQQDVTTWLGESTRPASIREFLHRAEKKTHSAPKHSKDTPER